jgi:hypothetical protein
MLEYRVQRNKDNHNTGMKASLVPTLLKAVMAALAANKNLGQLVGPQGRAQKRVDDMLSALCFSSRPELGRLPTVLVLSAVRKEGSITEFIGFFVVGFTAVLVTRLLFDSGLISFNAPAPAPAAGYIENLKSMEEAWKAAKK